jgi:integrase
MTTLELEPGEPTVWQAVLKLLDRVALNPDGVAKWYGPEADRLLLEQGIVTDDASRTRLLAELDRALRQAAEQQLKPAEADYSPDPKANRFPALSVAQKAAPDDITIRGLLKLWERVHLANGKVARTVGDFRHKIEALISYLGHNNAQRVTPENIADWCDHLWYEGEASLSAKTVSQKYLAVAKLVFGTGVAKTKLKDNPAAEVAVKFNKKPVKGRPKGYTDDESRTILKAALVDPANLGGRSEENKRAIRWGPWVCAFTGARNTEIMQLRTDDLLFETVDGRSVPFLRITPDAGSVKSGIQGHEDGRAASDYGETTIIARWREIQKLPSWDILGA